MVFLDDSRHTKVDEVFLNLGKFVRDRVQNLGLPKYEKLRLCLATYGKMFQHGFAPDLPEFFNRVLCHHFFSSLRVEYHRRRIFRARRNIRDLDFWRPFTRVKNNIWT